MVSIRTIFTLLKRVSSSTSAVTFTRIFCWSPNHFSRFGHVSWKPLILLKNDNKPKLLILCFTKMSKKIWTPQHISSPLCEIIGWNALNTKKKVGWNLISFIGTWLDHIMLHYFPVQNDITPKGKSLPSCGITCTDDSRNTHIIKYSQCVVLFSVGQFISDLLYVKPKKIFLWKNVINTVRSFILRGYLKGSVFVLFLRETNNVLLFKY